ncbi:MAG: hypothetical protein J5J06_01935 [Phycisphaerae bacterium]|nr:hypothetical protein [Phycisphaerae bacterium]
MKQASKGNPGGQGLRHPTMIATVAVLLAGVTGCMGPAPVVRMEAQRYRLEAALEPSGHRLEARSTVDLTLADAGIPPKGPVTVELELNPALRVSGVSAAGADVRRWRSVRSKAAKPDEKDTQTLRIVLDRPVKAVTLFVDYQGVLQEDLQAGEKPGQIHNFDVDAHIGPEGIYLGDGSWYPRPVEAESARPELADFELLVNPVAGMELVAGAERDTALAARSGMLAWQTPYPVSHLVLVGGPHEVLERKIGRVLVRLHLKPDQTQYAETLFEATARNLERYEPLIGPFPGREYAIVDNFFSSGFAFPMFTLLSSAVINMSPRMATAHGYLDHEFLHSWWGNGIDVDPTDGNWCEALASYGANYYGYVLDGNESEARRIRRNYCHFQSRLKPDEDKPLGTFGQEGGCGRGIAYQKGAMVFHMLARKIGQDHFWAAMRRLTDEYLGRYAAWGDIRRLCEEAGNVSLETFIEQWVRGSGAPLLRLRSAKYDSAESMLLLELYQGDPPFELDVPVRITHADGQKDIIVPLSAPSAVVPVKVDVIPLRVEVDPDFDVFRKVPPDEIIPTTATTRSGGALVTIRPAGEVPKELASLQKTFESSFKKDGVTASLVAGDIREGALAGNNVLILGDAVHDGYVSGFLSAIEFPVKWTDEGFEFEGVAYTDPGDALLCTVRHPDVVGGGITVVYANSEEALPRAGLVPFYDNSLVIFQNGTPQVRRDFEHHDVVEVEKL